MDRLQLIQEQNWHSMNEDPGCVLQSIEVEEEDPDNDISETESSPVDTESNRAEASFSDFLSSSSRNLTLLQETPSYSLEQYEYESREPSPAFSEAPTVVESRWTGLLRDIFILTSGYKIEEEDLDEESDEGDCITTVRELKDGQFPTRLVVIDLDPHLFEDGLWDSGRQLLASRLAEAVDEMKRVRGPERTRRRKAKVGGVLSIGEFSQFYHMSDKKEGLQEDMWVFGGKSLLHWEEDEQDIRDMLTYWTQQRLLFDA
ncbi:uncharacterized protein TRUGW13939_00243 [Talaromyces rugulosus]|uniref:Uncharacterized protein n=1 Tax=Talaromyces rugulosus TaxID=121627 RepID=A0A7H8QGV1_TALRU|nr:uncharacterized protein TRUGW13939_00243 [Talaromyces rugulosus]QKX53167.1 hypothetical protein TRUGW13939_00243 [Talaromyces rugulosus]